MGKFIKLYWNITIHTWIKIKLTQIKISLDIKLSVRFGKLRWFKSTFQTSNYCFQQNEKSYIFYTHTIIQRCHCTLKELSNVFSLRFNSNNNTRNKV